MEKKFTEGKWYVNTNMPGFSGTCISRFEPSTYWKDGHVDRIGDYPIATVYDGHNYWDEKYPADANAKLIASSPELLGRLKSLVLSVKAHPNYIFGEEGDEWHDIVGLAEEAIKKATE